MCVLRSSIDASRRAGETRPKPTSFCTTPALAIERNRRIARNSSFARSRIRSLVRFHGNYRKVGAVGAARHTTANASNSLLIPKDHPLWNRRQRSPFDVIPKGGTSLRSNESTCLHSSNDWQSNIRFVVLGGALDWRSGAMSRRVRLPTLGGQFLNSRLTDSCICLYLPRLHVPAQKPVLLCDNA